MGKTKKKFEFYNKSILAMMKSLATGAALASATLARNNKWPSVNVDYFTDPLFDDNGPEEYSSFLFLIKGVYARVDFPQDPRGNCWYRLKYQEDFEKQKYKAFDYFEEDSWNSAGLLHFMVRKEVEPNPPAEAIEFKSNCKD